MRARHAGYVHVGACSRAYACMCMYSGCTCACNACPINRICIVTYAHYMFVFLIFILMMHSWYFIAFAYVSLCFRLFVWIWSIFVKMQWCMICIVRAIIIVQLETLVVTTIYFTIYFIILISMCGSKLNLRTFHHIHCNMSQLFPRLLLMVASTTAVHSKP